MLKNYFKTALRNLSKHKSDSLINIAGLVVGFAAFLLIFQVIQYEQSFDDFHAKKKSIYRVVRIGKNPVNREYRTGVPFPVTLGLRTDFPQLANAAAIYGSNNVQVNVTAADGATLKKFKEKLGIRNTQAAIGKPINVNGKTFPIVGVVKDFHVNSLRDPIDAIVMTTIKETYGWANIKINLGKARTVIAAMEDIWNKNFPDYVFEYNFMDQSIADYYKQENQLSQLYKIFSGIAIFISCLGLYGLISFMAIRRKKEIGIRKVLGAPVRDIVIMLSRESTILIAFAFVIASPIAWYFMHQWLQQYTYRIMIGLWFFVATILGSLCIAWITVGYTAIKAAIANPVKSLRTE